MTRHNEGMIFYKTLSSFQRIRFYANAVNDNTVPYMTAAVDLWDPFVDHTFSGIKMYVISLIFYVLCSCVPFSVLNEKYAPIISSFEAPEVPGSKPPGPPIGSLTWFKSLKPVVPPFLQFSFPGNVVSGEHI